MIFGIVIYVTEYDQLLVISPNMEHIDSYVASEIAVIVSTKINVICCLGKRSSAPDCSIRLAEVSLFYL